MHFQIVTRATEGSTLGNRVTADRWSTHLESLGHSSKIVSEGATTLDSGESFDCLIGLHAGFSHDAIFRFRKQFPSRPIIVVITGTDLHVDLPAGGMAADRVRESLGVADRIVTLEPCCIGLLDPKLQQKTRTILQSAVPVVDVASTRQTDLPKNRVNRFCIAVVGHLRDVKDPLAAAEAARLLPAESNIVIEQWGSAITSDWSDRATCEMESNERYRWLGPLDYSTSQRKLADSNAMVISSLSEGAPSVISEAIVNDVPVLANKIIATRGLLGDDYPGFYWEANRQQLAELMRKAECDKSFFEQLRSCGRRLKVKFEPLVERASIETLIESIVNSRS